MSIPSSTGRADAPSREAGGTPFMYRLLRVAGVPLLRLFFRLRGEGTERIPPSGPLILVANHVSFLDPLVLGATCPRTIRFVMLQEFWDKPLLGWICRKAGSFPIDQDGPSTAPLRRALLVLRQGDVLGIFPEGGRSADGRLRAGRGGAAMLALRTKLPVVPAAIIGAERALPKGASLPRPFRITVRYGEPLSFPLPASGSGSREARREVTRTVMKAIADLARD